MTNTPLDETPNVSRLMDRISNWINTISAPEFKAYKRKQIGYVLADEFEHELGLIEPVGDFVFQKDVGAQHNLVMSFLYLNDSGRVLTQCQYYFRRYPFRNLPVTRDDHARNMCEFYFSNIYVARERLKKVLNIIAKMYKNHGLDIRGTLKNFDSTFKQELDVRHQATHDEPFGDLNIDRLMLTRLMSTSPPLKDKGWHKEHLYHYRRFSAEWSKRAKRRSDIVQRLVDSVAQAVLERATFLRE